MMAQSLDRAAYLVLLVAVAWAPLVHGSTHGVGIVGLRVLVGAALALAVVGALGRGWRRPPPLPGVALLVYVALLVVSAVVSPYAFGSWRETQMVLTYALGFTLAVHLLDTTRRRVGFYVVVLSVAALLAGYGGAQLLGFGVTPTMSFRVSSTYYNPNHFAGALDLLAPLALSIALFARRRLLQVTGAVLSVALLANVAVTYSRGAWVAVGVVCIALTLVWVLRGLRQPRPLVRLLWSLGIVAVAGMSLVMLRDLAPDAAARFSVRAERLAHDLTNLTEFDRVIILRAGAQVALERPLVGVGPGNFIDAVTLYRPQHVQDRGDAMMHRFVNYAHNDYLQVATETGLPSLLAFLVFWGAVLLVRSPRSPPFRIGITAGLAALLVHGLVDGNLTAIPGNAFLAYVFAGALHAPRGRPGVVAGRDRAERPRER